MDRFQSKELDQLLIRYGGKHLSSQLVEGRGRKRMSWKQCGLHSEILSEKQQKGSQAWSLIIPTLRKLRQKNCLELEGSLGYMVSSKSARLPSGALINPSGTSQIHSAVHPCHLQYLEQGSKRIRISKSNSV